MSLKEALDRNPVLQGVWIVVLILVIAVSLRIVIPPVLTACGLAVGLVAGSVAVSAGVATWVIPAASAGVALSGTAAILFVGAKAVDEAKKKPFHWIAPLLGVLSTFIVDFTKDLFPIEGVPRVALGATVGALSVGAGILWRQPSKGAKALAGLMVVLPIAFTVYGAADWSAGFANALSRVPETTWLSLALLAAVLVSTLVLAAVTPESS